MFTIKIAVYDENGNIVITRPIGEVSDYTLAAKSVKAITAFFQMVSENKIVIKLKDN
jgi:hypothetical protein